MNIKYTLLLALLFSQTFLVAEVTTIMPFAAFVKPAEQSFKNSGTISGIYANIGTLSYLSEFTYTHTDIKYKYATQDLVQDEITMNYSRYFIDHLYKVGIHTNTTTDISLQNGTTLIGGYHRWKWIGKSKLTYGLDGYYSYYTNGTNLQEQKQSVKLVQFTPKIGYFKPFLSFSNYIAFNMNYEYARTYNKNLFSFEFNDIVYYKKYIFEIGYFQGSMQTGILSGGVTVYNSKDILHRKFKTKISYIVTPTIKINMSYTNTLLDEYKNKNNLSNSSISFSASYSI